MIYTVTFNPALDKTYVVERIECDSLHRATDVFEDVGGKGINVSKVLKELGMDSEALVVLGGFVGKKIEHMLEQSNIAIRPFWVEGETRVNAKIVDSTQKTNTDVNEEGPAVSSIIIDEMYEYLFEKIEPGDIVVLAGSLPSSIPKDTYEKWIQQLSECGAKVILDTSGEAFKLGLRAQPYLIKPNRHEVEECLGRLIHSKDDLKQAAQSFIVDGVEVVCISDGPRGGYFFTKDDSFFVPAVKVDVKSTVGAGDSMVAGLAYMLENHMSLEDGAKLACALGTCSVALEGTAAPSKKAVDAMIERLSVERF